MRILVTGAGGFIGNALVNRLQGTEGVEVVALSRHPAPRNLPAGVMWHCCDLNRELPPDEEVDYIIHCAALQAVCGLSSKELIEGNLGLTRRMAEFGRRNGIKGFILASSISIHGEIGVPLVDEHSDIVNPSPYGISKHLCEHLLQECSRHFPSVSLRLCGVVGAGAHDVWLAQVLRDALRGESITIVNAESLFNNVMPVDDLSRFIQRLVLNGFEGCSAFPVASRGPMTIRDVVARIISDTGSSSGIVDGGMAGNPFLISNEYAIGRFGYEPPEVVSALAGYCRLSADIYAGKDIQ